MSGSYKSIDYRVRPGKSIERKMLAESFRRLVFFRALEDYCYIGMGSLYFADFSLFHRSLGFRSMVSIEDCGDATIQRRFKANAPFGNIAMEFGRAGAVLQRFESWKQSPSIIWLDYDGKLSAECLSDLEYVASNAASGTVLIVSVNADRLSLVNPYDDEGNEIDEASLAPLEILEKNVKKDRIPLGLESRDLSGWGISNAYRNVIDAAIRKGSTLHASNNLGYEQIYNFQYNDGAKMLTVGGVLFSADERSKFENARFEDIDYIRKEQDAYRIDPPKLTYTEMRAINSHTPNLPLPPSDIEKFQRTYRYFPHFIEAEVG
ncbi:O-methyltransferase [Stenotrophomonas maltophilia]|uniref:O-methyltransferase n=1 Tax=Stenotrophomonas maltophilia TaxID=40324 RepID=UPI00021E0B55|nr:O-methyltransferase [Stenotrophomonas maltophilia]AEM49541.1 hypothetical protein BurJV3_0206 [Stenotrophomonas maltophilia JV3]